MKIRQCLLFAIPLLVSACATPNSGPYNFKEGWRPGKVEEISTAGALLQHQPDDCREEITDKYAAPTPFALVSYRSNRMTKHRAMPMPEGMAVKVGEVVFVNLETCVDGLAAGRRD